MRSKVIHIDTLQSEAHYPAVARKTISISYDPELLGDLVDAIRELRNLAGSPYFGRSQADIGGLLLAERLDTLNVDKRTRLAKEA